MPLPRLTFAPEAQARESLTPQERRYVEDKALIFYTNSSLLTAIVVGLVLAWAYGHIVTASVSAFAAALGLGGVLGFLFGVPGPRPQGVSDTIENATVSTGDQSVVNVGTVVTPTTAPTPEGDSQSLKPPVSTVALSNGAQTPPGKTTSKPVTPAKTKSGFSQAPASNLEQVADWVTKLLLGGGLTQISNIPPKIWQWSHAVAIGILGTDSPAALVTATQSFAAGLMVYGFVLGFFAGFLITKIQLGKAISS